MATNSTTAAKDAATNKTDAEIEAERKAQEAAAKDAASRAIGDACVVVAPRDDALAVVPAPLVFEVEGPPLGAPRRELGVDDGVDLSARRARVVYAITADGKEEFGTWANTPGPEAWEDEGFAAHMAFFGRTESRVRLRILEGRRSRLEERVDSLRESVVRGRAKADAYTLQLQQHGLDGAEREVRWLNELIQAERSAAPAAAGLGTTTGTTTSGTSQEKEQS